MGGVRLVSESCCRAHADFPSLSDLDSRRRRVVKQPRALKAALWNSPVSDPCRYSSTVNMSVSLWPSRTNGRFHHNSGLHAGSRCKSQTGEQGFPRGLPEVSDIEVLVGVHRSMSQKTVVARVRVYPNSARRTMQPAPNISGVVRLFQFSKCPR